MNIIRCKLNNLEAKRWAEGFIIQNKGEECKIHHLQFEARIEGEGIEGCIEVLERFKGTKGIESITIEYSNKII